MIINLSQVVKKACSTKRATRAVAEPAIANRIREPGGEPMIMSRREPDAFGWLSRQAGIARQAGIRAMLQTTPGIAPRASLAVRHTLAPP